MTDDSGSEVQMSTVSDIAREIIRCDEEIARMEGQETAPAYLVCMGIEDWRRERRMLLDEWSKENPQPPRPLDRPHVTPRELAVLSLVADGLNAKEIAKELRMAPRTAAFHRSRLLGKFRARNAVVLVRHAIRIGLIDA